MKKNALEELNEKGMALEEPKMPKQIGIVQMLLIFGGFIFIVLSTLFGVISDCFNCGSEYNSSIERWQNYEPNQILVDQNDRDGQQILLMLNDTLTDAEEGEVIRIFENAAKQGRSGLMVDFLSNRVFDYDTLNGFEWLRVKWNEDFPRTNTSFVGLWKMVLYAVTASDIFKKKLFINEFQFSKVEALCLRDKKITYEQIKKIYANKSKKSMVYALMTDIQSDTSIYAPGVNRLMKEVFNIPESEYPRQTKSNFYKTQIERAKEIYGL